MKARFLAAFAAIWLWLRSSVASTVSAVNGALEAHAPSQPVPSPNPSAAAPIDPTPEEPAKAQEQDTMGIFAELGQDALNILKQAGLAIETFVLSEGQKLVAAAKETFVGTAAMNIISALESETMDGSEKMETVIAAAIPLLEKLVAGGGLGGLVTSVEDFAREFCQSVFNDFKAAAPKVIEAAVDTATADLAKVTAEPATDATLVTA